jgi:DNA primase
MELAVATLPAGLDPCDLLVQSGADTFRRVLDSAVDALEFKLNGMLTREEASTVEGRRRIAEAVLGVIAPASVLPGQPGAMKTELIVSRLAQRLTLREERLWARLVELRQATRGDAPVPSPTEAAPTRGSAPAAPEERRLLELLLAEPELVARAQGQVSMDEISHPGLRRLLTGLFTLLQAGDTPSLDRLRQDLEDNIPLVNKAFQLQDAGVSRPHRLEELEGLLAYFGQRREKSAKDVLKNRLQSVPDDQTGLELLRRLQNRNVELGSAVATPGNSTASGR